jgi:hypothetical protein
MLLLSTHESWRAGDFHATRQQQRLRVALTEGFEPLDELQEWVVDLLQANLRIDGKQRRAVHLGQLLAGHTIEGLLEAGYLLAMDADPCRMLMAAEPNE